MIEKIKQVRKEVHLLAPVTILTSSLFILGSDYNIEGKLPETLLQNKYVSNKFEYGFSLIFRLVITVIIILHWLNMTACVYLKTFCP